MSEQRATVRAWPGLLADDEAAESALRSYLSACTIRELRAIGKRRGFRLRGTAKAGIVEQLIAALRESARQPDILEGLTEDERNALLLVNTLFGVEGSLPHRDVQWAWESHNMPGGKEALQEVLNGFFEYGLLYRCRDHYRGPAHYHWLPDLGLLQLPARELALETLPRRKWRRTSRPRNKVHVLKAVWLLVAFLEREPLRMAPTLPPYQYERFYPWLEGWEYDREEAGLLAQSGYGAPYPEKDAVISIPIQKRLVAPADLGRLAVWVGGDADFAEWLVLLAMGGRMLNPPQIPEGPFTLNHDTWNEVASLSPEDQFGFLFHTWRQSMPGFSELSLAMNQQTKIRVVRSIMFPDFRPTNLTDHLGQGRRSVLRSLQSAPARQWLDWNHYSEGVRTVNPVFLHAGRPQATWGFATRQGKRLDPQDPEQWDMAYRPTLAATLEGPLRWLGIVDVAYRGSNLVAFQLTETGAWALRGEGQPLTDVAKETGKPSVSWQNKRTFRVRLSHRTTDFLKTVGEFATPTNRPFTYQLTNESIERAFTGGTGPAAVIQAFENLGAPMPTNTRRYLEDTWSRFGRMHLYGNLTVLELADDMALREIVANTNLEEHIIHEFSPRLVVVEDSAVDKVVEALVAQGYTPRVERH